MKKKYLRQGSLFVFIFCALVPLVSCGLEGIGDTASIQLSAADSSIPADGASSTAITATIKDSSGQPVLVGTPVRFSTTLGSFSNGSRSYTASTPDVFGDVSVSLIAGTISGDAIVTATSNSVTQNVSVELTESVAGAGTAGNPASIEVHSVQRESISVTGSGEPETSKATFVLKDINGLEVADGYTVNFSIVGGGVGGGETISSSSDTTLGGYVDTTLQSGTTAGTVKIKAELSTDPSVATNVSITIQGGPPYGEHLGLNPETLNIAGLVTAGLEDTVTMRVTDKYFNNVPDGSSVYFTCDYGGITGADTTESNDGQSTSFASATLTSQVPDPADGFVTPATSTQSGAYARVLCMAIDSTDSDIIYLGTDGGGIFKTTNGGTDWSQVGKPQKGLTNGIVRDIEIDSENPAIVYAATDEGVFRSTGSGDEWEYMTRAKEITGEGPIGDVAPLDSTLDTTDADNDGYSDEVYTFTYYSNAIRSKTHVYLTNPGQTITVETDQYIYTSAKTIRFIVMDLDLLGYDGWSITIDYTTPVMISADCPVRALALRNDVTGAPETSRTLYAGTYGNGIYQSQDSGFSWTAKNSGLSDQDVLCLAIDPTAPNSTMYAGTQGGGVFKTVDSAATWAASNSGLPASVIHAITIDPNTTANLYAGTEQDGVYRSINGGGAWLTPATNVTSTRVTKIVLDSTANPATEIYAATYGDGTDPLGGVYKSSNSGDTWTRLTALSENHVHALGIIAASPDTLFAGTWGRNIFRSADGGTTWSALNGSAPDELTNQIFATSKVLFSGYTAANVVVQTDTDWPWQGAGGDDYQNDDTKRACIYHGGYAAFVFTVQDANGNPLVNGTTISASVDHGKLSGNKSETLPDTQTNRDYWLTWTNDITVTENKTGTLTIKVTSEDNGDFTTTVTRGLIKPVAVELSTTTPVATTTVTVTPSGGSETMDYSGAGSGTENAFGGYTVKCPNIEGDEPCNVGGSVSCTADVAAGVTERVVVIDDVTGESVSATWTTK
ncbi:MAG: hypothetical protein HWN68_06700 [Desulfobacterales bacterium]|nr:hypothetical protein [Desulfobacterales bacterium]